MNRNTGWRRAASTVNPGLPALMSIIMLLGLALAGCSSDESDPAAPKIVAEEPADQLSSFEPTFTMDNPMPSASKYNDVWSGADGEIVMVGEFGMIMRNDGNRWIIDESGVDVRLMAIWGEAGDDLYVVGYGGVILHYDGQAWRQMRTGVSTDFRAMWGTSSQNLLAVGGQDVLLRYDGVSWEAIDVNFSSNYDLNSVWGSGSGEIYIGSYRARIHHFDGINWETIDLDNSANYYVNDIWGSSADDVFAVCGRNNIWHFDGQDWNRYQPGSNGNDHFYNVWGTGPEHVMVGGQRDLWRFDGDEWSTVDGDQFNNFRVDGIHGMTAADFTVIGEEYEVYDFDGFQWTERHEVLTTRSLREVFAVADDAVYAVSTSDEMYFHDGSEWSKVYHDLGVDSFDDIWGDAADNVYAVANNRLCHFDGASWEWLEVAAFEGVDIRQIVGRSATEIFVAGGRNDNEAALFRFDGSQWLDLYDEIAGLGLRYGRYLSLLGVDDLAMADYGDYLVRRDGLWSRPQPPFEMYISALWGTPQGELFIANPEWGVVVIDDGARMWETQVGRESIGNLWGRDSGEVFAMSGENDNKYNEGPKLMRWDGASWELFTLPGQYGLASLTETPDGEILGVGNAGLMMRITTE